MEGKAALYQEITEIALGKSFETNVPMERQTSRYLHAVFSHYCSISMIKTV